MFRNRWRLAMGWLLCLLPLYLACATTPSSSPETAPTKPVAAHQVVAEIRTGDVTPIDEAQLKSQIERLRGKVILLNIWATWCPACRRELPALTKLYGRYASEGLEILAVSFDAIETRKTCVEPFLEANRLPFPTFIKNAQDEDAFIAALGNGWKQTLPSTFIYDRTGHLVIVFNRAENYDTFAHAIEPLLDR